MPNQTASSTCISDDGQYAAQQYGKELVIHLNRTFSDFKQVNMVKAKESASRFLRFSRSNAPTSTMGGYEDSFLRRILCAGDTRIMVWQLNPTNLHAEIESLEPGALNIDFGGDENEVIVFHAWHTKLTVFGLDTGRSQVIKTPKFSHHNGFGYRPKTRQFAVLLKPDANDILTIHEFRSYELVNRAVLPTVDAQGLKWSPDGRWIAVWDAASTGTKVLIYTGDGQLFRTYTGPPEADPVFDLGVRCIEWSPVAESGTSESLAVGKVDGSVDILQNKTVRHSFCYTAELTISLPVLLLWRIRFISTNILLAFGASDILRMEGSNTRSRQVPRRSVQKVQVPREEYQSWHSAQTEVF